MAGPGIPDAPALVRSVESNRAAARLVSDFLTRVPTPPSELATVSVSRLLNPGRTYYDVLHPLPEDLAAHQSRLAGTGAHDLLEKAVAAGVEYTEIWLKGEEAPGETPLDRITARLDAAELRDDGKLVPTEIKNVGSERDQPPDEHLEQLGMYCALIGVDEGRLLAVLRDDAKGTSRMLVPWRVRFSDLDAVRREMARRRDLITESVRKRDPSGLPACPWWEAGCKYREAKVCDCGTRPALEPTIARGSTVEKDPEYLAVLQRRAAEREAARSLREAPAQLSLAKIMTPRKVYFASRQEAPPEPEEGAPPAVTDAHRAQADRSLERVNTRGLEQAVFAAVRRAQPSLFAFAPTAVGARNLSVPVLDGLPFLVRVRHVGRGLDGNVADLTGRWGIPDDLRQLALRAALLGRDGARAYVWNWKLSDPEVKLQAFDVRFDPARLSEVRSYAEGLSLRLERAVASGDHRDLPLCPRWMCPKCPYLEACRPDEA